MTILKYQLFGRNSIGVYIELNNLFGLYPSTLIKSAEKKLKGTFKMPLFPFSVNNSNLIGVYTASNKNGIIVPHIIRDDELNNLKAYTIELNKDYNIGILKSIDNTFGNLILCNDKGAIISNFLKDYKAEIGDILGVDVVVYEFAENHLPGSIGLTNNKGCLVHPLASDEEVEKITSILRVNETDVSTVNRGIPYLSSGAAVNDTSGIFGLECTGPEMMRLTNVLGL
jgi:translation initiation factor 6